MEEQLCGGDSLEPLATSLSLEMEDLMLMMLAQGISSPSCRGKKRVLFCLPPPSTTLPGKEGGGSAWLSQGLACGHHMPDLDP